MEKWKAKPNSKHQILKKKKKLIFCFLIFYHAHMAACQQYYFDICAVLGDAFSLILIIILFYLTWFHIKQKWEGEIKFLRKFDFCKYLLHHRLYYNIKLLQYIQLMIYMHCSIYWLYCGFKTLIILLLVQATCTAIRILSFTGCSLFKYISMYLAILIFSIVLCTLPTLTSSHTGLH